MDGFPVKENSIKMFLAHRLVLVYHLLFDLYADCVGYFDTSLFDWFS